MKVRRRLTCDGFLRFWILCLLAQALCATALAEPQIVEHEVLMPLAGPGAAVLGDATGGSSGSPVLNARGELVGVNFDRVWENIANDFGYNPDIARNVSVDIRYLLWHLGRLERPGSLPILQELGVASATQP